MMIKDCFGQWNNDVSNNIFNGLAMTETPIEEECTKTPESPSLRGMPYSILIFKIVDGIPKQSDWDLVFHDFYMFFWLEPKEPKVQAPIAIGAANAHKQSVLCRFPALSQGKAEDSAAYYSQQLEALLFRLPFLLP